jgi:5-methylcytosine-specific restriction endonuclease McrA
MVVEKGENKMKKAFVIIVLLLSLLLAGCRGAAPSAETPLDKPEDTVAAGEQEEETIRETEEENKPAEEEKEPTEEDIKASIDLTLYPNELGEIMILMYHGIGREQVLSKQPLCVICLKDKRITPARVVDHIKPHKGDGSLFFDLDNLQSLCKSCHDRKTAKEDGRWKRKVYTY